MTLRKKLTIAVIVVVVLGLAVVWFVRENLYREVHRDFASDRDYFTYGSIGVEEKNGIPYWIWKVAPELCADKIPRPGGYEGLGLVYEQGQELPVGITLERIGYQRIGLNCAVCHTNSYRMSWNDPPTILDGAPARFDVQAYIRFFSECAADPRFNPDEVMKLINAAGDLSFKDKLLYRYLFIPGTKKRFVARREHFTWMNGRPDWGPGRVDDFNLFKYIDQHLPIDDTVGQDDVNSVWREPDEGLFHWDGNQTLFREANVNAMVATGALFHRVDIGVIERIEKFLKSAPVPKHPVPVNEELAAKGRTVFEAGCARCHGDEEKLIPLAEIGTDPERLKVWTQEVADVANSYSQGQPWALSHFRKTEGYATAFLYGVWATSPYLHNGSVPTLRHLLEPPENRPQVYYRGIDVYDPVNVGYIHEGAEAERRGFRYDTTQRGNGNGGHLFGTDLPPEDKEALLEYLKTL